jgi:hypothetical protein
MPKIIAKWRSNKAHGRYISKMFKNQEAYHGMNSESWDLAEILNPHTDEDTARELLEHLNKVADQ